MELDHQALIETLLDYLSFPPVIIVLVILGLLAIAGQWLLYEKCDLKGIACIVPVWNVIEFLKIMGRPAWQSLIVMIPPPIIIYVLFFSTMDFTTTMAVAGILSVIWGVYMAMVYIELCQSFGKRTTLNYVLCLVFNGFYVLYLGLSDGTEYQGPVRGPNAIKTDEKVELS